MIKFVFLTMCALAYLQQATPSKLSKEFGTAQEIERQQSFDVALKELQNFDFLGAFVKLVLRSPEQAVANVNELLTKNSNAGAQEILNAFNAGLNAQIFVINGDYIEIDQAAFGRMLFENTRDFAQLFYPSFQQRSDSSMYQRKLQDYVSAIEIKQPLEQFTGALTAERRQIDVKAITLSSILNAIASYISSLVLDIVSRVESSIVNLLTSIMTLITNISTGIETSVQTSISWLFVVLNPIGILINTILQQIVDFLSSLITSVTSRKRREVTELKAFDVVDLRAFKVFNTIATLFRNIAEALVTIISEIADDVTSVLTPELNSVFSFIANIGLAFNTIFSLIN